jgi:DNA-binding CsgD family transcriptional regulator
MSASRTVKLAGLKSVKQMADLLDIHRKTIHAKYNNDREMFDALLKVAVARWKNENIS